LFLLVMLLRRLVILAIVLAIPVVAGEFVARALVGAAVKSQVTAAFGGSPSVSFGSTPLLLQLVEGHVTVDVTEPRATIPGLPPVALTADFNDIHLTNLIGLHGVIGGVQATARLGRDGTRDILAASGCVSSLPANIVGALGDRPRVRFHGGHVTLLPQHGHAVTVHVVPTAAAGKVDFSAVSIDGDSATAARSNSGCVSGVGGLPFGLSLTSASVAHSSLELAFSGQGARFAG
jgi:hypothetical protein